MSCERYKEWLALDAGGDLPADKAGRLAQHLDACPKCRAVADDLRGDQNALQALHRSPLPEERLDAVRSAVLAELQTGNPPPIWSRPTGTSWLTPRWALAGAAAALTIAVALWHNAPKPREQEPVVATNPAPPALMPEPQPQQEDVGARHAVPAEPIQFQTPAAPTVVAASRPPQDEPAPARIEQAVAREPAQPDPEITVISPPPANTDDPEQNQDTVLQLASSNPDITIYWLIGPNGD